MLESELNSLWLKTSRSLGIASSDAKSMWDDLRLQHSEPHRHYHTMTHVADMLDLLVEHQNQLVRPVAV